MDRWMDGWFPRKRLTCALWIHGQSFWPLFGFSRFLPCLLLNEFLITVASPQILRLRLKTCAVVRIRQKRISALEEAYSLREGILMQGIVRVFPDVVLSSSHKAVFYSLTPTPIQIPHSFSLSFFHCLVPFWRNTHKSTRTACTGMPTEMSAMRTVKM